MIRNQPSNATLIGRLKRFSKMLAVGLAALLFHDIVFAQPVSASTNERRDLNPNQPESESATGETTTPESELAKQVFERWQKWVDSNPEQLTNGELIFPDKNGKHGKKWLLSKLKTVRHIVEPESTFDAISQTPNAPAVAQIVRQQIGLGNLTVASEIVEQYTDRVNLLSLLNDTASYAAIHNRPELLDWVYEHLAEIPDPVSDAEDPNFGIQLDKTKVSFVAMAARLELLRRSSGTTNAIIIEETALQLQSLAGQFGNHFRSTGLQTTVTQLADLESWSNYSSDTAKAAVEKAVAANPALKPLAKIAQEYSWNPLGSDFTTNLTVDMATAWVERQNYRGRHKPAIAFVVQSNWPKLTRARLLSRIAGSLADKHKEMASTCANVAQALMREAVEGDVSGQHWQVLETAAELAIALQAMDESDRASDLLKQGVQFWNEHQNKPDAGTEEAWSSQLVSQHSYRLLALLEAVAVTDVRLQDLGAHLRDMVTKQPLSWGYADMNWQFNDKNRNLKRFPGKGFERTVDLSKFLASNHPRPQEASFPQYFHWFDMSFWPQAINAYRTSKNYGAYKNQGAHADSQNKSLMLGQVVKASMRDRGLKSTLSWAEEIDEPTVRMAIELDAVIEAYSEQIVIPPRDVHTPRSIVPFQLMWRGC